MNKRQIEKLAAKVSSTYHIRFFMNKRETRIAIKFINESHEIVGSIDAEKINEKDTYTVTCADCDIKGIGKMLYYFTMHFIYPNYLKPDDEHTDDAARVWKGIFNMLDCDERAKFRFHQNYFNI